MHFSTLAMASAFAASAAAQMSLMEILTANNKTLGTLTGRFLRLPILIIVIAVYLLDLPRSVLTFIHSSCFLNQRTNKILN